MWRRPLPSAASWLGPRHLRSAIPRNRTLKRHQEKQLHVGLTQSTVPAATGCGSVQWVAAPEMSLICHHLPEGPPAGSVTGVYVHFCCCIMWDGELVDFKLSGGWRQPCEAWRP